MTPLPHIPPRQARMYRGVPYATKARGVLNVTGINEGIVQGSNFKPGGEPVQYESSISRAVKTTSTGKQNRGGPGGRAGSCCMLGQDAAVCMLGQDAAVRLRWSELLYPPPNHPHTHSRLPGSTHVQAAT
jgi:hypothetical protein